MASDHMFNTVQSSTVQTIVPETTFYQCKPVT